MKKLITLIVMTSLLTLLHGCGGGSKAPDESGQGSGPPDDASGNGGSDPGSSINGELTGRVFYNRFGWAYEIDLATGERSRLYTDSGNFVQPSMDGKALVYVDDSIEQAVKYTDRVTIRDGNGRLVDAFDLPETVYGPVKMSPDRQTIALFWRNRANNESDPTLTLLSRGDSEWQWRRPFPEATSFTWMPNGRLLYAQGKAIYMSDINLTQGTLVQSLPDFPWQLDVSRDGQQVAFTLPRPVEASKFYPMRDVWTMKLDGSGLRQVTASSSTDFTTAIPVWSPDGKWIMLRSDFLEFNFDSYGRLCPKVYAVPADALRLNVKQDPLTIEIKYFDGDFDDPDSRTTCGSAVLTWLPPAEKADPGSLPQETERPNRGLTDTLYYRLVGKDDSLEAWALDLSSGQRSRLPDTIRGTAASADGQEFAYITSKDEANAETVVIVDRNGNETVRFSLPYAIEGPVRFSPNGNLLAFTADETVKAGKKTTDNAGVIVMTRDGASQAFFSTFNDYSYDWLSEEDLVLGRADGIYRGSTQSGTVAQLFPLTDPVFDLTASPDGLRLAFRMIGRLWVSDLDGQNLQRLTKSEGFESRPEWSPDGRYIAFKHWDNGITKLKSALWVVAANARGVHIGTPEKHRNGIAVQQIGEDGNLELIIDSYSYPSWR